MQQNLEVRGKTSGSKTWGEAMHDAWVSGTAASVMSTAVLALMGKAQGGSAFGPTNAVSHWLWGDKAGRKDDASAKYTLVGYITHHASALFWATLFEKWGRKKRRNKSTVQTLRNAAITSALACVVDYTITPKRLTPGYEKRLSKDSLFLVYASLAVGLTVGAMIMAKKKDS